MITNHDRAQSALTALNAYAASTRFRPDEKSTTIAELAADDGLARELIGDLICDELHLADEVRLGADWALGVGLSHYDEELAEETP